MEYATLVDQVIVGRKFIFFKDISTGFDAIYLDEKFYKKKKWPGHLGGITVKFQGKGKYDSKAPSHLTLDREIEVGGKCLAVHHGPSEERFNAFLDAIDGDYEILDSAKYSNKKGDLFFTAYNCYDNRTGKYYMMISGLYDHGGKGAFEKAIKFVEEKLIKSFRENI